MKNLKKKLTTNQKSAAKREKLILKEKLGDPLLSEELIKTITPSRISDENRLIRIPYILLGNLSILNGKLVSIKRIKELIERTYNSAYLTSMENSALLIPLLPEDVAVNYLPHLMVLSLSGFSEVRKTAENSWKKLNPEELLRKPLGKNLNSILKFISDNWNNPDYAFVMVSIKLISILPKRILSDYLPLLAMLTLTPNSQKKEASLIIWRKLKPKQSPKQYIKSLRPGSKKMQTILNFIENNWDSDYYESRVISAKLISLLPKDLAINYLPQLAVLTLDKTLYENEKPINFWKKLKPYELPEQYIKSLKPESKEMQTILNFIKNNWNSIFQDKSEISIRLISSLPEELIHNYIIYLTILTFDGHSLIRQLALESWNRLRPDESPDYYIGSLEPGSKEMQIILNFIENKGDSNSRFVIASINLIPLLPKSLSINYLPGLLILFFDMNSDISKAAKYSWKRLNPESWVKNLPIDELEPILEFIDENWNSDISAFCYASARLIDLLPENIAFKYLPELAFLAGHWDPNTKEAAMFSWRKLNPEEKIKHLPDEYHKIIIDFIEDNWTSRNFYNSSGYSMALMLNLVREKSLRYLFYSSYLLAFSEYYLYEETVKLMKDSVKKSPTSMLLVYPAKFILKLLIKYS